MSPKFVSFDDTHLTVEKADKLKRPIVNVFSKVIGLRIWFCHSAETKLGSFQVFGGLVKQQSTGISHLKQRPNFVLLVCVCTFEMK